MTEFLDALALYLLIWSAIAGTYAILGLLADWLEAEE